MNQMDLKDVYEAPLAQVRGVFLCENVAGTAVSVLWAVDQDGWADGGTVTPSVADNNGDLWLGF